jgi:hypothetical protein
MTQPPIGKATYKMTKQNLFFKFTFLLIVFVLVSTVGCKNTEEEGTNGIPKNGTPPNPTIKVEVPDFNADSAYFFIEKQVEFGPRVPNTEPHRLCAEWLESKLKSYTPEVMVQSAQVKAYDGSLLEMNNIIASFNPERKRRILLCAHWDTRPWADEDTVRADEPILGANDGGSGVAVLIEIARQLSNNPVDLGIDIILFDTEDYGKSDVKDSYCLGSQHWGRRPHKANYKAEYGILLDMVGGENATFKREAISMHFAKDVVDKVWKIAAELGFRQNFMFKDAPQLTDDHLYINTLTGIPCIDIIEYDQDTPNGFGTFWHTHQDNMDIIDKATLDAVGQTLLTVICREAAGAL